MSINSYELTIAKLKDTLALVNRSIETGDYSTSHEAVKLLRNYKDCFYCSEYRTILESHEKGCCKNCPLHKYGEKKLGREIPWNGCYKIPSYREMVRLSWSYAASPNPVDAKALVIHITACMKELQDNKGIA